MSNPTADVSVRVAWVDDAPAIADLQLRAWRDRYADLVPPEALPTDVEAAAASLAGVPGLTRRCAQPGDGGPGAQPGRGLRHHLPGG